MKIALWIFYLALLVAIASCAFGLQIMNDIYGEFLKGRPFPELTRLFLAARFCLPAFTLPWLIAAGVLSRRNELAPSSYAIYSASCVLAIVILAGCSIVASLLPFVDLVVGF
jgi:hypothetical protein